MVLLDAALHLVYELPIGAVMPTGAWRGSARPDHGPHAGGPCRAPIGQPSVRGPLSACPLLRPGFGLLSAC